MLKVIEVIPYRNFKEKIRLVKEYQKKNAKVEILGDLIYIQREIIEV